ncbi:MAG: cobalamin biosynthesis protein CobD [Deltaproteobacteria bacterium]|nr:MAG: cobalamin biosynthesis protein CobD [Deltaproteobacteria bacterium]
MSYSTYCLLIVLALCLDFLLGDPRWYPHPVRGIGWLIEKTERVFRRFVANELAAGFGLVVTVLILVAFFVYLPLLFAQRFSPFLEWAFAVALIYSALSTKDLLVHSTTVFEALENCVDITLCRRKVAMMVGRDTSQLSREQVCRACVESVAENMVDGSTAPLFYALLGGGAASFLSLSPIAGSAVAIFVYKAINTMDSMLGYKNQKYLYLGRVAARLDDVVNYIPARLSAVCLVVSAALLGLDWRRALRIYLRDNDNHSSPNAGHPEAAVSGALGVQLGGPSVYFGKVIEKPLIGDSLCQLEARHIRQANKLVVVAVCIFCLLILIIGRFIQG